MEIAVIKVVSNKCMSVIDDCLEDNVLLDSKRCRVVITRRDLDTKHITQKLVDEVTGLMKSLGVCHARYQSKSKRFFGVVTKDTLKMYNNQ